MRAARVNPLEQLVLDEAEVFADLVEYLTTIYAPVRPWWSVQLTKDQQLWRWEQVRDPILSWLYEAGQHMGWETPEEVLANLELMFTSPVVADRVPPQLIVDLRVKELRAMVQASGPKDAARHIRKMEAMYTARQAAVATLTAAGANQPNIPENPAPLPISVAGPSGWPYFGGAPADAPTVFGGEPAYVPSGLQQ